MNENARQRILNGVLPFEIFRFGTPIAIGMGLQTTFALVDTFIIARLSPEVAGPALGASSISDQLTAIGTIVSFGLTTASTAMIARAHGAGEHANVRRYVWQSILAVAALALLFGGGISLFARTILEGVVGVKGEVAAMGVDYLRVNAGGSFTMFFLLQLTSVQRALGSSKTPVLLLVGANVLNLVLSVLFSYGPGDAPAVFSWGPPIAAALGIPRMDLMGAAWSTFVARSVFLVPVVWLLFRRFDVFDRESVGGVDERVLRSMWSVAWPSSTQLVVRMLAMLMVQSIVARAFTTEADTTATTAMGIVFKLETMALFIAMGWGSAAQTFIGQNLGAGQEARSTRSGWWATGYNAVFTILVVVPYLAFGAEIVGFFDATPAVVATAKGYLDVVALSYLALGTSVVLGNCFAGGGASRVGLINDLIGVLGFQVPACLVAIGLLAGTMHQLWVAVAIAYVFQGLLSVGFYAWVPWTHHAKRLSA